MYQKIVRQFTIPGQKVLLTMSFFMVIIFSARSQSDKLSSDAALAEKIYLQLDNNVYTNDQTIWFKSVVTNAVDHAATKLSGVLYVELIDQNEKLAEKKLVRLNKGTGNGFFQLNQYYKEGLYQLRAYTQWAENFGPDFFFTTYIRVFATTDRESPKPIKNIVVDEGQNGQRRITADFEPAAIDSLHTKELTVFLSFDSKTDTLSIQKSQANGYQIDRLIPAGCRLVTVQVQTKNNSRAARTIILDKNHIDLHFYPESGRLVHGLAAVLGVKATGIDGHGKLAEGEIVNGQGAVVASFKTNRSGIGKVILPVPDSTDHYVARLMNSDVNTPQKTYALPAVVPRGNILSARNYGDKIELTARSNYLVNDSILIEVSCRGAVYFDIMGRLKNGQLSCMLASGTLPEGILQLTLKTDSMKVVAERLYFNDRPENDLDISIAADSSVYTQRDLTKLSIEARNSEGQPVVAELSLAVMNKIQQDGLAEYRQNIRSYFLLSADLKEVIENAGYYFSLDKNRLDDLDALLLTQGPVSYRYTGKGTKIIYPPEPVLTVSGTVKGGLFDRKQKSQIGLTLMSFGQTAAVQTTVTDSAGRFSFNLHNEFGETINIILQSTNKAGAKRYYNIELDKRASPPVVFDHLKTAEEPDSIVKASVKKSIERKKAEDAYKYATEGITLDEVILKSYPLTPERKKVIDQYGKPTLIIDGKNIREKEAKWSYGLYSVLLFNFPDKVNIYRNSDGNLYAKLHNNEITLVVIDGIPVRPEDYPLIPAIPPSEVSSFEIIEYAQNFIRLYCEVYPAGCANPPPWGNVIAIYTYGKKGIFGARRPVGILNTSVPVFSPQREFYAPAHNQPKPADWLKPDLRSLVYWQPTLAADSTGRVVASFYNADNTGAIKVVVEAISESGSIGYQEFYYDVKKNRLQKR